MKKEKKEKNTEKELKSSHLVIARKYRPSKFAEVIGQNHITTTLKNAILKKKIPHAFSQKQ